MFRILTKRILTCLFLKKGLFSILVQNSPKVTKKVLVFRKVASSFAFWQKKLLKILKVAKTLPSRIWKGLSTRASRIFCTFPWRPLYHCDVKRSYATFHGGGEPTTTNSTLGKRPHLANGAGLSPVLTRLSLRVRKFFFFFSNVFTSSSLLLKLPIYGCS